MKSVDDARFEKFLELIKNLCLQIPLVDAIKIPPYSKYMKDIVTNKRKIPNDVITAMLAS
jgi:pantothenate kinase